jgi:hypothetical protein
MVNLAPGYALTGFVLAGKPGVLCLEGASPDIKIEPDPDSWPSVYVFWGHGLRLLVFKKAAGFCLDVFKCL